MQVIVFTDRLSSSAQDQCNAWLILHGDEVVDMLFSSAGVGETLVRSILVVYDDGAGRD